MKTHSMILYNPLLTVPAQREKIIRKIISKLKERKEEDHPTATSISPHPTTHEILPKLILTHRNLQISICQRNHAFPGWIWFGLVC